ncbi:MAG TPA: hypothetical protein ENI69_07385 [Rhodospirillales bacterium]|nr:hypothetical protein [Rhodospirillales bacterium]
MSTAGKQSIAKTSQVDRARKRLEKAVERLDQAISAMPATGTATDSAEMTSLQADNARLQESSRVVADRLEHTIGKLKAVLEG